MGINLKKLCIFGATIALAACQNQNFFVEQTGQLSAPSFKDNELLDSKIKPILPTYGALTTIPYGETIGLEYLASSGGRLTIKDGCVKLTYPKEYYAESTRSEDYSVIPIFPGNFRFIENGTAIEGAGVGIFKDGDFVEMGGLWTSREFWRSMEPGMPYNPIPEHCKADKYWLVSWSGLILVDK